MKNDFLNDLERIRKDRKTRADYGVKGMKWGVHKEEEPEATTKHISKERINDLNALNTSVTNGGRGDKEKAKTILDDCPIGQKLYCKGERGTSWTLTKTGENTWEHSSKDGPYEVKTGLISDWYGSSGYGSTYVEVSDSPFEEEKSSSSGRGKASPAERRKSGVMASGNKWAIENWKATH